MHLSVLCILASALGFICLSPMVDAIPFCNSVTQGPCLIDAFVICSLFSIFSADFCVARLCKRNSFFEVEVLDDTLLH